MAYEIKPNSGSLWTAKSKKSAKSPDITGKLKVVMSDLDVETDYDERGNQIKVAVMKLSAWRKTTKEGDKFLSLSLNTYKSEEEKAKSNNTANYESSEEIKSEKIDPDIPF
jgi:hypothetical protein